MVVRGLLVADQRSGNVAVELLVVAVDDALCVTDTRDQWCG